MPSKCDHCGYEFDSDRQKRRLGDHTVHRQCAEDFVDERPKIQVTDFTCSTCYRSFHTEYGLETHTCYDADGRIDA